jgi:aminoglycoside 6'-N-acetyltransferase
MNSSFSRPEDSPGFLLWRLTNQWQRQQRQALQGLGLTHPQFVVLAGVLWLSEAKEQPVTQQLVSDFCQIDKMSMSDLTVTLLKKKYLKRLPHPQDKRAYTLSLTTSGHRLVLEAMPIVEAIDDTFFCKETPHLERLSSLLKQSLSTPVPHVLAFRSLALSDMPLMHQWFNKPHVQQFYSLRAWTEQEVIQKLTPYINGEKPLSGYVVYQDDRAIGYVQTVKISDYPWPDQQFSEDMVQSMAGVDLFIGEQDLLACGLGGRIMKAFLDEYIWLKFCYCVVDPDVRNLAAIKCYEKIGFKMHRQIDTEDALQRPVKLQLMFLQNAHHE